MVEYSVGDPYYVNRDRRDRPEEATVVPWRVGVNYETANGLTERFMYWVVAEDGKSRYAMSGPCNFMMSRRVEFGQVVACPRLADDGLFKVVIFACDEAEGISPTEGDAYAIYERIAKVCVREGVKSISVPLLFANSGINAGKVAKAGRAVFRDADVDCMLFITPTLMAKVHDHGR